MKTVIQFKCFINNDLLSAVGIQSDFSNMNTRQGDSFKLFHYIEIELTILYGKSMVITGL